MRAWAVVAVLTCTLTGCGTDGAADEPSGGLETPSYDFAEFPTRSFTCDLRGPAGGSVTVTTETDGITMAFTGVDVIAPTVGTLLFQVMAYDAPGETGSIFEQRYIDGDPLAPAVFDSNNAMNTTIDPGYADLAQGAVSVFYPRGEIGGPSRGVQLEKFEASVTVDADEVGSCQAA